MRKTSTENWDLQTQVSKKVHARTVRKVETNANIRPFGNGLTMSEQQLISDIQAVLTPDLLNPEYLKRWTPLRDVLWGHCYAASEALFHMLGGKAAGYTSFNVHIDGESHWFIKTGDIVLDPTFRQFIHCDFAWDSRVICAHRCRFLTRQPSKQAADIIRRVKKMRATLNRYRTVR